MKNEVDHILKKYFSDDPTTIHYYGDGQRVDRIGEIIGKLVPFDHPDAYAILDDEIVIFEHFEFDSSENQKRKGSQQKRSQADDNRAFAKVIPTEEGALHHGSISADYSMENYKNNLIRVFCKHYSEIDEYKQTIRERGIITGSERITTLFFIEDVTIFGNLFKSDNPNMRRETLSLPLCDFFLACLNEA